MANSVLLELSFRCSELPYSNSHAAPSTLLSVQYNQADSGFWTQHTQSDIVQGTAEPLYQKNCLFLPTDQVDASTKIRFVVYKVSRSKSDLVVELGSCFCFIEDLIQDQHQFTFHLQNNGDFAGCLHVTVVRQSMEEKRPKKSKAGKTIVRLDDSLAASLKPNADNSQQYGSLTNNTMLNALYNTADVMTTTYQFPLENGETTRIKELTLETCLSFHIPLLFLKLCINEEKKKLSSLESLGKLAGHWEAMRQKKISLVKQYLDRYQSRFESVQDRYGAPFFKKSVDKAREDWEFIALNLHLQRMCVENKNKPPNNNTESQSLLHNPSASPHTAAAGNDWIEHDVITVGAAANHAMGFKHGGLLSQLNGESSKSENQDRRWRFCKFSFSFLHSKKNPLLSPINDYLQRGRSVSDNDKLLTRIISLREQVKYQIDKLRLLIKQSSSRSASDLCPSVNVSSEVLDTLSRKIGELVTCFDNQSVLDAVTSLANAKPVYRSLYDHSPSKATPEPPNPIETDESITFNGTDNQPNENSSRSHWEEQTLLLKSALSDVVKSSHPIIHPDQEEIFLGRVAESEQFELAENHLTTLHSHVEELTSDIVAAMTFVDLRDQPNHIDPELAYRRNTVFSQALSMCIAGVCTLISSSLRDGLVLQQFSDVGIFLQVESLVSTYGNELAMLQDYAVGVFDLSNVSFKCVRASSQQAKEPLSKTRNSREIYLPVIHGSLDAVNVFLSFDDDSFSLLPLELQNGKLIKVFPVIYNVGINEEQTLAGRFGSTSLQDYLNSEAKNRTLQYYDLVRDRCPSAIAERLRNANSFVRQISSNPTTRKKSPVINEPSVGQRSIMDLLNSLSAAVHAKKNKNVEVLQLAADICRRLNGVRITSCKSAKDRTSMSVTLEQARILVNEHDVARHKFTDALTCMRSEGTRRENANKNTGSKKYAFTSVQLMTFPKLYRAPEGTYGKGET